MWHSLTLQTYCVRKAVVEYEVVVGKVYPSQAETGNQMQTNYRKVVSSRLSLLVALPRIFRRLMKGKCDAYVLQPLAKKFQNLIVDQSTARNFTV